MADTSGPPRLGQVVHRRDLKNTLTDIELSELLLNHSPDKLTKVTVALNGEQFSVHKDFLCYYSPNFRAALAGGFAEADKNSITLEDTTSKTFSCFVDWLYAQPAQVGSQYNHDGSEFNALERQHGDLEMSELLNLYIFADAYDIPYFRNDILTAILGIFDKNNFPMDRPTPDQIIKAYDSLPENSPLVRLFIDVYMANARGQTPAQDKESLESLPAEFMVALIMNYRTWLNSSKDTSNKDTWGCDTDSWGSWRSPMPSRTCAHFYHETVGTDMKSSGREWVGDSYPWYQQ